MKNKMIIATVFVFTMTSVIWSANKKKGKKHLNGCEQISGTYISGMNSTLVISVSGNIVKGKFIKKKKKVTVTRPVIGSVSNATQKGVCPVSLSVSWPGDGKWYPSVTSYTGTYISAKPDKKGKTSKKIKVNSCKKPFSMKQNCDKLRTIFLMVDPTVPTYKSVVVGHDHFYRIK